MCVFGGGGGRALSVFVLINWLKWVTMVTALAVLAVGYGASLTSPNGPHICIKSLYMPTMHKETERTDFFGDIVVV